MLDGKFVPATFGNDTLKAQRTQRTQEPLAKEYTLNQNIKTPKNLRYIPEVKGIGFPGYGAQGFGFRAFFLKALFRASA